MLSRLKLRLRLRLMATNKELVKETKKAAETHIQKHAKWFFAFLLAL